MTTRTLTDRYAAARAALAAAGQEQVLRFYDQLDSPGRDRLLDQIEQVDWPEVSRLIETHVKRDANPSLPERLKPAPYYPRTPPAELASKYDQARALGERLLGQGKVAAFTVAGGQGTRLGWEGPKGTFPATPIRRAPLFEVFAEFLRKAQDKYGASIPWYVMTSPLNDQATRAFFDQHDCFGLRRDQVMLFAQGMLPAIEAATGKVLLDRPDRLALSPDGHGGSLKALHASGALADMNARGIEHISYVQVDNPLVKVVDPLFLGLHALDDARMSSKMLPKAHPHEKLGNFCLADGRMTVIEYSDLPAELAEQRLADGALRFRAGSIAIHAIRVDFVKSLNRGGAFDLPYHRAKKKVAHVDPRTGERIEPGAPNAVKLETFVFDALPLCGEGGSIVLETERVEEFAPIKDADAPPGQSTAPDSPAASRQLQTRRAARWLEGRGVELARDAEGQPAAVIEIRPITAVEPADLDAATLPASVRPGDQVLL